ncbi:hypothetical protein [Alteromonas sp. ASW11-130]|uniref:hypothetical protein n=1 Tax=Alteromonas sp. ASW11-130 TaxID=3015775 RepID=UPI002242B917|nr:hypothetical protein [Alteromonas sp. ASW11-130]MCW8091019.1 hypothetical protein [Alteromonas sp. ASW11-130]
MKYIPAFHSIVYDQSLTFDTKVSSLLQLGQEVFNVDVGMVAHIDWSEVSILFIESDLPHQKVDSLRFPLKSFCKNVLEEGDTTTGDHSDSRENHFFLGTPIFQELDIFGVIAFSSTKRAGKFPEKLKDYIEMFAKWYGSEVAYQQVLVRYQQRIEMLNKFERLARVGTWEVDLITNQIMWSDQTKAIHEVAEDYVPNLETAINFYKEGYSREAISKAVEDAITTGESWQLELEVVTAKNKSIWVKANGMAEFVAGECVRLFGTFHDISHEVIIREDLKAELANAERAFHS